MSLTAPKSLLVRAASIFLAGCVAFFACGGTNPVFAQDTSAASASSSTLPSLPADSTGIPLAPEQGAMGGAAAQDWMTIMMLVSMMVDPDDWVDAGGTNRMIPYPNGVWIDPQGHIKRMQANRNGIAGLDGPVDAVGPWRAGSGLRTVSLKQLDEALAFTAARGLPPTAEMLRLAGLTHIQYVAVDVANRDVLIAGPAGQAAGQDSGFLFEDLRTLAQLASSRTQPLGCSLDPQDAGLVAAQQFLADSKVIARLGSAPATVSEQLKTKVGPHAVNIFGLDPTSSTALALVDVDEHMKRVGLGLASTTPRIKTYFDHLNRQGQAPAQSLIRWWFTYNPEAIQSNAAGDLFQLPNRTVAVMSQQQWINA
jgi:hypothetical protein